jgi:hypothetical protein
MSGPEAFFAVCPEAECEERACDAVAAMPGGAAVRKSSPAATIRTAWREWNKSSPETG